MHEYVDEMGNFRIISVQPEQCIPLWKTDMVDELELMIRYYQITVLTPKGNVVKVNRVEIHDEMQSSYFQQTVDTNEYYLINNNTYSFCLSP